MDELRRAYAVLGLKPGASSGEVRRAYRFLARRWHPDRHAADPRNQQEAGVQMRRVNEAYHAIVAQVLPASPPAAASGAAAAPQPPGRRLSREELDGMVAAIGTEGPVDWLLGSIGWVGSTLEGMLAAIFVAATGLSLIVLSFKGDWRGLLAYPETLLFFGLLAVLGARESWARARLGRAPPEPQDYGPPGRREP